VYIKLIGQVKNRKIVVGIRHEDDTDYKLDKTRQAMWEKTDYQVAPLTLENLTAPARIRGGLTTKAAAMILSMRCKRQVTSNTLIKAIERGSLIASYEPGNDWWIDYSSFVTYQVTFRPRRTGR